ncbi:putative oxysterol-binding protein [Phaeoacremonium minimum UCRPA7]|uniref:Putative oxysterol-binding protein n=1 Tax=Phaeoacremonium minimum (strain UCR-PA7) TaxID=1286976 RepID=R8BT46_PHAM7|nr:putative oxysterol-binding protein [Phaeoacremonium minimum UCRPA7]EOO02474.1 putative oxysterol-binding protein [Phaeoacremonium minimum UCRPA7]
MAENGTMSPQAQASGGSWTAFLKSIASFNGDLSSLTAPPFILSSTSLTEFSSYWCEHPSIFAAPAKETDPKKRAMLVLRWFLTTLKQQYASRSEQYGNEKKPLNPFLGELFLGKWEDDAGTTELISEQVSHHPPATAYSITNVPTGVHLEGYNAQKATFTKTINVKQIGHAVLTVPAPGGESKDTYLITLPSLHIEGLLFGSPFIELDGASYITSSTGFTAKIDYSGKGWLSGKKNSFTAVLHPTGKERDVLYSVNGQWTKSFSIHAAPAKQASAANLVETYDPDKHPSTPLTVAPLEAQHPLESRRAWAKVAAAVAKSDMDAVSVEKGKIETAQRELRAKEKAEGRLWQRRYFSVVTEPDPILKKLGPVVGVPEHGDADKTGGLWRFDPAKAEKVRSQASLSVEDAAKYAKETLGQ